jgi:hypothetical protein
MLRKYVLIATLGNWFFRSFLTISFSLYLTLVSATNHKTQTSPANLSLSAHQNVATTPSFESKLVRIHPFKPVNFELELASEDARHVADWVIDSGDNHGMPFVIVDKTNAKVFVFNAMGRLRGAAAALLGLARGDDSVPGIGDRQLSSIRPDERTTPAGRFVASLAKNLHGEEILWVDYDTGISLHRVHTTDIKEQRGQRLSSLTTLDNRISFGCINVPVKFYKSVVSPAFTGTNGIVYVLPEIRSLHEVFDLYYGFKKYAEPLTASKP